MPTPALSAAKMRRPLGLSTIHLANNSVTTPKIQQLGATKFIGRYSPGTGSPEPANQFLHVKVPGWTNGSHITNWSTVQNYLSSIALSNRSVSVSGTVTKYIQFGSFPGGSSFVGGVVAPSGYVYFVPGYVNNFYKINPNNYSITTFGTTPHTGAGLGGMHGGVLAPNGKIYFIPYSTTMCYGVDPINDSVFSFGGFTGNTVVAFAGLYSEGILAPNGKIYCMPNSSSLCQVIDPSNNSVASFGTFVQSGNGVGGVLAPNGKIYMAANSNNVIRVIDPSNNTVTDIVTISFVVGGQNATVAPNGNIYYSGNSSLGLILDPSNNTVTSFGTFGLSMSSYGARSVLMPNGQIYCFPHVGTLAHVIDPTNNSVTSFSIGSAAVAYHGGVQTSNGYMILIPHTATSALAIPLPANNYFNTNVITNPLLKP